MASIRKQKSGRWRVQVRRKGQAVSETFVRYEGAKAQPIDAMTATSWADGRLVFSGTPLQKAVSEVNRYLTHKIELDAPDVADTVIILCSTLSIRRPLVPAGTRKAVRPCFPRAGSVTAKTIVTPAI